jgi:hypothetical protein
MNRLTFLIFSIVFLSLSFHNDAKAFCANCDYDHFMEKLMEAESGDPQANTTIESGGRAAQTAMGKYQILHTEAVDWGCIPGRSADSLSTSQSLSSSEINSFLNNESVQDQCFHTGIAAKYGILEANGLQNGGGGYDCGALLATAWLGNPVTVANGGAVGDANNSSYTTKDRADEFQGVCAGGDPNDVGKEYPGRAALIGCDPQILEHNTAKKEALQQMETEAAKALIGKPTSVMQTTCFEQYTQQVSEIGRIHSDPPQGISDTIVPNVEQPAIQFTLQNFLSNVLSGGIQSALNSALGSLTSGLTGGGGGAGTDNCSTMDEMWKILQCVDFPQMPGLSDILGGGGGGDLSGILSGLGGEGGLGSLGGGGGGGGIMGAVCQAAKSMFGGGGGGSGATETFENLAELNNQTTEDNSSIYADDIHDNSGSECNYAILLPDITNMDADLNDNNIIEVEELIRIDFTLGDQNCDITDEEINFAVEQSDET